MSKNDGSDNSNTLNNCLRLGIIQTTTNAEAAWKISPKMSKEEADHASEEVKEGLRTFTKLDEKPHFIILPELAVPISFYSRLATLSQKIGAVLISGMDYRIDNNQKIVTNRAIVIIPQSWPEFRPCRRSSTFFFGKTYAAPNEEYKLRQAGYDFRKDTTIWVFDADKFGKIGVCICYDFMDVERYIVYRRQIHHLFVLAYNRDIRSFYHLAESLARTIFCNVVVCNTGFYGGSVAVSPYYEPNRRTIYRHEGKKLFTTQVIDLPVGDLNEAQKGGTPKYLDKDGNERRLFKNLPPGYKSNIILGHQTRKLRDI